MKTLQWVARSLVLMAALGPAVASAQAVADSLASSPGGTGLPGASANPHDGMNPHGGLGRNRAGELFDAPADTAEDDATLPAGAVLIELRDAHGTALPDTPFVLTTLRASVMRGDSQSERHDKTDAQGKLRLEGLQVGAQLRYGVRASRGPATFGLPPFGLGTEMGKRVVLHVYESTPDLEQALVGLQGFAYLSLKEGVIQVEEVWSVFNVGAVAWLPRGLRVALPSQFRAFKKDEGDGGEGLLLEEVSGQGVSLQGTVSPGRHDLSFRYQVPLDETERQTLRLPLPPRMAQMQIVAEASAKMGLEVEGFAPAERTQSRDGKRVLATQKMAARMDGGLKEAAITLSGLPTPSPTRWAAAGLAATMVVGALWHRLQRSRSRSTHEPRHETELRQALDSLLDEMVRLEKGHRAGTVGPKAYQRVRSGLIEAIARIEGMLRSSAEVSDTREAQ